MQISAHVSTFRFVLKGMLVHITVSLNNMHLDKVIKISIQLKRLLRMHLKTNMVMGR